jgi:hypothetical protein
MTTDEALFPRALRWLFSRGACWECAMGLAISCVERRSVELHGECAWKAAMGTEVPEEIYWLKRKGPR